MEAFPKIIIILFIWMALPLVKIQENLNIKAAYERITTGVYSIVGILIVMFESISLIKSNLNNLFY